MQKKKLQGLGIQSPVPKYAETQVLHNPIDIYRAYLAEILIPLIGVDPQLVYDSLQWTNNLAHGDLVLAIPKLRSKGVKPNENAKEIQSKVCGFAL